MRASLAGQTQVTADEGRELTRSLLHVHLAAVSVMANQLDLADLLVVRR